jgi:hypothetical protein
MPLSKNPKQSVGAVRRSCALILVSWTVAHAVVLSSLHAEECRRPAGATRRAILDVVRTPVESRFGMALEFKVERIRQCGSWAFVLATPQRRGGVGIRWSQTPCKGDTSHFVGALVRWKGEAWRLVDYALCPSDVAWADWPERHSAPTILFGE